MLFSAIVSKMFLSLMIGSAVKSWYTCFDNVLVAYCLSVKTCPRGKGPYRTDSLSHDLTLYPSLDGSHYERVYFNLHGSYSQ